MTLPVLQKIGELVDSGMKVAGVKPERSPSLNDDATAFGTLVNKIWSNPNVSTQPLETVLSGITPKDVIFTGEKAKILYVHRQTADTDIYWLDNRSNEGNEVQVSFRVTGKIPVLWNPETGKTSKVSYQIAEGRTTIPLKFDSWQAYFIVFNGKSATNSHKEPVLAESKVADVTGAWTVRFQAGLGAPAQAQLSTLTSLSENADAGIKYFSGTATYENALNAPAINKNARYWLDLGDVKNLAEVIVNGKNVGITWKKPFRIDVTEALKEGSNSIQVKVTNTWVNRLIGDAQPGVTNKIAYTTMPFYKADSQLPPSGLLGPVKLVATTPVK
jgi:hypothetical protein